jgi:Tfp pilus assembly protein PilF
MLKRSGLFLLILVCSVWSFAVACDDCASEQVDPTDWELQNLYQRANKALTDGKYRVAETELRKVLDRDSEHIGAMTKLARALEGRAEQEPNLQAQMFDDALLLLQKAAELEPDSKVVWSELARISRKAGQSDRAIAALRNLTRLKPSDRQSMVAIAQIQEERGQNAEAEKTYKARLGDNSGDIQLAYGRFLVRRERLEEAMQLFTKVVACPKPKQGELVRPGPCPTAEYYEAQDELGALAVRQGRLGDARKVYAALVQMFPEDYMAWEVLGALDEKEGDFKAAEAKYRQSLAVDRVHMSGWRGLGRCLAAQSKRDDAAFAFRKADHFLAKSPSQALEMCDELMKIEEPVWAKSLLERAQILVHGDSDLIASMDAKLQAIALQAKQKRPKEHPPDGGTAGDR